MSSKVLKVHYSLINPYHKDCIAMVYVNNLINLYTLKDCCNEFNSKFSSVLDIFSKVLYWENTLFNIHHKVHCYWMLLYFYLYMSKLCSIDLLLVGKHVDRYYISVWLDPAWGDKYVRNSKFNICQQHCAWHVAQVSCLYCQIQW